MSSAACMDQPNGTTASSQHHSTYATFRSVKSSSTVLSDSSKQQFMGNSADYPNVMTSPNSRGSSVVSAIIRSSSFMSAEEEAHRMLRANIQQQASMIISSPVDHKQRLVPAMAPTVPVPASFSEHLLSLDHADSLLLSSSSSGGESAQAPAQLIHHQLPPLPPQSSYATAGGMGAESQRSLASTSSAGYHSSSSVSGAVINRSNVRSLVSSDDASPPPSSASSASSSSSGSTTGQSNIENSAQQMNSDFFAVKAPPSIPSSPASSTSGSIVGGSAYVPRCTSAHTALAAIDEELPPLQQAEVAQVDIFYRSLKTDVRVASSMAQMFVEEAATKVTDDQDQVASGVPLFLVDKFPSLTSSGLKDKSKRSSPSSGKQILYLILAERGTGFTLKRERISQRDCYTLASTSPDTHRLTVMGPNGSKVVYLIKFASSAAAGQFFAAFTELTKGDAIFPTSSKKSQSNSGGISSWWKGKLPSKLSLSRPCCFRHLTNLDSSYLALSQTAVIASPEHRRMSQPIAPTIDPRSQTMPRRASVAHSTVSSVTSATSNTLRPSALSPMSTSIPCRVSMTPLAACPPIAPTLS